MTTLAAWVGVDQRQPASLYLVADSRFTWPGTDNRWDSGRKLFASRKYPVMVGYAGDVLFPTQILGQYFESMDGGVVPNYLADSEAQLASLVSAIEIAARSYPPSIDHDFSVLFGMRVGDLMDSTFTLSAITFTNGRLANRTDHDIPEQSALIAAVGSGADRFRDVLIQWQARDSGGTSRAVYSAFAEHLVLGGDPQSGGPPQLVGLIRRGSARMIGVVWQQKRYFCGMEIAESATSSPIRWHNDLFELCDPGRTGPTQLQPLPRNHREDLAVFRRRRLPLP